MLNHTLWEKPNTSFRKPPCLLMASLVVQTVKNPPAMWDTRVRSLGQENPLENKMATHCNILAWRIPWTGKPGGLQSMALQRVGHDWMTCPSLTLCKHHNFLFKLLKFVCFDVLSCESDPKINVFFPCNAMKTNGLQNPTFYFWWHVLSSKNLHNPFFNHLCFIFTIGQHCMACNVHHSRL